jgi:excisionase family DNA binding protein
MHPRIVRLNDACQYLALSRATIYRLIESGQLHPVKLGASAVGFELTEIDAFIDSRKQIAADVHVMRRVGK